MTVTVLQQIILVLSCVHVLASVLYHRPESQDPSEAGTVHVVKRKSEEKEIIGSSCLLSKDILQVSWSSGSREGAERLALGPLSVSGHSCDSVDLELALPVEVRAIRSAVLLSISVSVP